MGFLGYHATQIPQDYELWETVLDENNPPFVGIIELGTAYGGFSLFLSMQALHRGMDFFRTFDEIDHRTAPLEQCFGRPDRRPRTANLGREFRRVDLIRDGACPDVVRFMHLGPVALFCDNGHKAKELELYAPHCLPGSFVLVHDWLTEVGPSDIPDCLEERYGDYCDEIKSWTRVFERV
jgi:cephalosporin hydroxylase